MKWATWIGIALMNFAIVSAGFLIEIEMGRGWALAYYVAGAVVLALWICSGYVRRKRPAKSETATLRD